MNKYAFLFITSMALATPSNFLQHPKVFSLHQNQAKFAHDIGNLLLYIYGQGYSCSLGEGYRTEEQAILYAKEGKGIRHSQHCIRLALDIDLFSPSGEYLTHSKDYEIFGKYWVSLDPHHNRWGGDFHSGAIGDGNHFERQERDLL